MAAGFSGAAGAELEGLLEQPAQTTARRTATPKLIVCLIVLPVVPASLEARLLAGLGKWLMRIP
jgi:hypothetical protein